MSALDARWPLPALPSTDPARRLALSIRGAIYDLGAVAGVEGARGVIGAPRDAFLLLRGVAGLCRGDRTNVLRALDMAGIAAGVVGILVGAVLRAETERQSHALCCGHLPRMGFSALTSAHPGVC